MASTFPSEILLIILGYLAPSTLGTFILNPQRQKQTEDFKDLVICRLVCRQWYEVACTIIYRSTEISYEVLAPPGSLAPSKCVLSDDWRSCIRSLSLMGSIFLYPPSRSPIDLDQFPKVTHLKLLYDLALKANSSGLEKVFFWSTKSRMDRIICNLKGLHSHAPTLKSLAIAGGFEEVTLASCMEFLGGLSAFSHLETFYFADTLGPVSGFASNSLRFNLCSNLKDLYFEIGMLGKAYGPALKEIVSSFPSLRAVGLRCAQVATDNFLGLLDALPLVSHTLQVLVIEDGGVFFSQQPFQDQLATLLENRNQIQDIVSPRYLPLYPPHTTKLFQERMEKLGIDICRGRFYFERCWNWSYVDEDQLDIQ